MRIAFVSPLPPAPTGIADYSADVLRAIAGSHEIELFHGQDEVDAAALPAGARVFRAVEIESRHAAEPFDVALYQMGNGPAHAFLYEHLARLPGLLILHDLVLHHSRARMLLDGPAARGYAADPSSATLRQAALAEIGVYREEIRYSYPSQADRLADASLETVGTLLPYAYPLFRLPVEASRAVGVHNGFMARGVAEEVAGAAVARVVMPMTRVEVSAESVAKTRRRHGIAGDEIVVGCFGLLTPEKRIDSVARAVARAQALGLRLRLLLVGPAPDPAGIWKGLIELGLRDAAILTGRVSTEELPLYMETADIVAHLRYPTARETSAALLRVLAQGRATIAPDLRNIAEIPTDAVVRADLRDEEGETLRAILRLAARRDERERLGRAAAAFVAREHSLERCQASYRAALELARRSPARPRADWPAHWKPR